MFSTAIRPVDLLDRVAVPWAVRETAALKLPPENPSNPSLKPVTFNLLAPLFNAARAIQINQYESQKESGYEWLFNYKAVLNTRVSTITTKLSNALTSDLEAIFGKWPGGVRNIRRDPSGIYVFEPAPSADEWAHLYGASINAADPSSTPPTVQTAPNWEQRPSAGQVPGPGVTPNGGPPSPVAPADSIVLQRTGALTTTGTVVIQSGGTLQGTSSSTVKFHDGSVPGVVSSRFWATYLDLFNNIEFTDCWRYGLLDKVVVAATAATGNGSQLQSSLTLRAPDILKMVYPSVAGVPTANQGDNLNPGDPYPGQSNNVAASPMAMANFFSGGSTQATSTQYNNNYQGFNTRGDARDAHGLIQTKFTAFWHS